MLLIYYRFLKEKLDLGAVTVAVFFAAFGAKKLFEAGAGVGCTGGVA
jgi:hypothetical protein